RRPQGRRRGAAASLAAFEERGHPVVLVQGGEQEGLGCEVKVSGGRAVGAKGELGELEGTPGLPGDLAGEGAGGIGWVVGEFVDEAGGEGFGGGEAGAGVQHAAGDLLAGGLGEPPVAAGAGDDAEGGLGLGEERAARGHAQVAGESELAAAAEGGAVDRGDRGPAVRFELLEEARVDREERAVGVAVAQLGDVGAGGEYAWGRGVDDEHARLLARLVERGRESVRRRLVNRVALIRPVQADPPDSTLVAYFNRAHRRPFTDQESAPEVPWRGSRLSPAEGPRCARAARRSRGLAR